MGREIMGELDITEASVPVPGIGRHFTVSKYSWADIDTSAIDISTPGIIISIGDIFAADMNGTLAVGMFAAGAGILVVNTGVGAVDILVMGGREAAIKVASVADGKC